ncbi:hypothetical protein DHEL01_v204476 [Diaporthe helianthi]|uniref:BTB domain-containing protein n=1 Tax=Diaporthe helianthi TaxID=158607 RepID=A0A2P5I3Q3_DIAHE|nr:hypothetical protein DHEL01_v204476 [Diaporthe helianthi]
MPPKRKRGDAGVDDGREKFRKRGDLGIYFSGTKADLALTVENQRILLHQQILISRVGFFKEKLLAGTNYEELEVDDSGIPAMNITTHNAKSVLLMVEFVYGEGMVEIMEYPTNEKRFIQDCILLFNLGHSFDIPDMVKYAITHLGKYLSRKLKDICHYPLPRTSAAPREFMDDLEAGINKAQTAKAGITLHAQKNHPRRMLIDFLVVGGDVLVRDSTFRFNIGQDILPAAFLRDTFLAQTAREFQTPWMKKLMVRPGRLEKAAKSRGRCSGCQTLVAKDQQVVFNPWSHERLEHKYTQLCCGDCAKGMNDEDGSGVWWDIFEDMKEE